MIGKFDNRNTRTTRIDVARRAGVSTATVSYVINDGPRPVAAETRQRVLCAIRELDYSPLEAARSLRYQRTRTLGLILPDTANPFWAALARAVEEAVFAYGWSVLLCNSCYDGLREAAYAEVMISKQVDGVLYVPGTTEASAAARLVQRRIPVVTIDREVPDLAIDCVVADNCGGSAAATRHLLELGHRRIGLIIRYASLANSERRRGYELALLEAGVDRTPGLIASGGFGYREALEAMKQLLELRPAPTAVLAFPDITAIGAMAAIHSSGFRIPEDISIMGFDDIPVSAYVHPPLSTVAMPISEMGRRAAQKLLDRINSGDSNWQAEKIILPTQLIIRGSTGPAKATSG
jgi:LacI family transcriptional regulator